MNLVIDFVLIAIIVISAFFAAKKGLIATVFSLLSTIMAIVLSVMLSGPVSSFIDTNMVKPAVKNYILGVVDNSSIGKSYEDALNSIDVASTVKTMPSALKQVLELADIDVDAIVSKADSLKSDTKAAKDELIDSIASPISGTISKVITLLILFVVLSIALWFVSKLLTALVGLLPLGKSLNKIGGLAFGIIRGLIVVFAIAVLFTGVSRGVKPDSDNIFSQKTIESTIVLKTITNINPIGLIMNIK